MFWISGARKKQEIRVVEARGVEPLSENATGEEPTYLVAFMLWALPHNVRLSRSERTRRAIS